MQCISPLLIRQNGRRDIVPCGKCNYCLQTKRSDWTFRILQELKVSTSAYFLTLTYSDEHLPPGSTVRKTDLQNFNKRLRKRNALRSKRSLRYYAVGEYGTQTERPHYHSILFNLCDPQDVEKAWPFGHVMVGDVNIASIHYVTKYVINRMQEYPNRDPPFALMSRRPALGASYLDTHTDWHRAEKRNFTQVEGTIARLPRYYKEKIFNRYERAVMALESTSQADIEYWETVQRLKRFSDNPEYYYEERISFQHEQMLKKINKKNTF